MRKSALSHLAVALFGILVIVIPPITAPSTFFLGLAVVLNFGLAIGEERAYRASRRRSAR